MSSSAMNSKWAKLSKSFKKKLKKMWKKNRVGSVYRSDGNVDFYASCGFIDLASKSSRLGRSKMHDLHSNDRCIFAFLEFGSHNWAVEPFEPCPFHEDIKQQSSPQEASGLKNIFNSIQKRYKNVNDVCKRIQKMNLIFKNSLEHILFRTSCHYIAGFYFWSCKLASSPLPSWSTSQESWRGTCYRSKTDDEAKIMGRRKPNKVDLRPFIRSSYLWVLEHIC